MLALYDKNYYVKSKISNYTDYRKKKFDGLATDLFSFVAGKRVLDYGAATGGLVKALFDKGIDIVGTDISTWAVDYGKSEYKLGDRLQYYSPDLLFGRYDLVLFLDVLEHIDTKELIKIVSKIRANEVIVRIPVSKNEGELFVLSVSNNDKTHIQIHCRRWWIDLFKGYGFDNFERIEKDNIYDSAGVLCLYMRRS